MLGIVSPMERSSGLCGLGVHPLAGPAWLGSKLTVLARNPLGRAGAVPTRAPNDVYWRGLKWWAGQRVGRAGCTTSSSNAHTQIAAVIAIAVVMVVLLLLLLLSFFNCSCFYVNGCTYSRNLSEKEQGTCWAGWHAAHGWARSSVGCAQLSGLRSWSSELGAMDVVECGACGEVGGA